MLSLHFNFVIFSYINYMKIELCTYKINIICGYKIIANLIIKYILSCVQKSRSTVKVSHSVDGTSSDEGHVQTAKIDTEDLNNRKITDGLYISMWAVNSVSQILSLKREC